MKVKITGDNNGTITEISHATIGTVNISSGLPEIPIEPDKKETTIWKIVGKQVVQVLSGVVTGVLSKLIFDVLQGNSFKEWKGVGLLILDILFAAVTIVLVFTACYNLLKCIKLRKKGSFVALLSKAEFAQAIIGFWDKNKPDTAYEAIGKVYKNIGGVVYELRGCKCPICKSEPIGKMRFRYNKLSKTFELVCNENHAHILEFDYKMDW